MTAFNGWRSVKAQLALTVFRGIAFRRSHEMRFCGFDGVWFEQFFFGVLSMRNEQAKLHSYVCRTAKRLVGDSLSSTRSDINFKALDSPNSMARFTGIVVTVDR